MSVTVGVRGDRHNVTAADVDHRAGFDKLHIVVEVLGLRRVIDGQRYLDTSSHSIALRSRLHILMPNTHRRRRRDVSVELSRVGVGVGGVYS